MSDSSRLIEESSLFQFQATLEFTALYGLNQFETLAQFWDNHGIDATEYSGKIKSGKKQEKSSLVHAI